MKLAGKKKDEAGENLWKIFHWPPVTAGNGRSQIFDIFFLFTNIYWFIIYFCFSLAISIG